MHFTTPLLLAFAFANFCNAAEINVANTQIWGPGLRGDAMLPVRYFYIQSFDKKNKM